MVGKYTQLNDAYLSVIEALHHGGAHHGGKIDIKWVDSERLEPSSIADELEGLDGILVPGGFGVRGVEGKILAARFARERGVPYLGICLGHAGRGRGVRPPRGRHGRRQLDRVRPRDAVPGDRPPAGAEGGARHGRHDAPGRRPGEAPREHACARDLRRGRHLRAPPPPLRGEQPPSPPARAGGPRVLRHLARTTAWSRSSSCPTTRSSWPRSSTRSSSRGRSGRSRSSATSWAPRPSARASARPRSSLPCSESRAVAPDAHPVVAGDAGRARAAAGGLRPALRDPQPVAARARGGGLRRGGARPRACRRTRARPRPGADAGNLYARIPAPEGAPTILLCAHLDTVPLTGPIEVDESEGRFTNRFEAILGADNKAAVAAFMGVARRFAVGRRPVGHRVPLHDLRGGRARRREGVRPRARSRPTTASCSTTRRRSGS